MPNSENQYEGTVRWYLLRSHYNILPLSHCNLYAIYSAVKALQPDIFWQNIYNFFNNIAHGIEEIESNRFVSADSSRKEKQLLTMLFGMKNKI